MENVENVDVVESIEKSAEPTAVEKQEQEKIVFEISPNFIQVLKQFAKLKGKDESICLELNESNLHIKELDVGGTSMLEVKIPAPNLFGYLNPPKAQTKISFSLERILESKFAKYGNLIFTISENSIKIKQDGKDIQVRAPPSSEEKWWGVGELEIKAFKGENEIRELNLNHTFKAVIKGSSLKEILRGVKNFDSVKISLNADKLTFRSISYDELEMDIKVPLCDGSGFLNEGNQKVCSYVSLSTEILSRLVELADDDGDVAIYLGETEATPVRIEYSIGEFNLIGYIAPMIEA